MDSPTQNSIDAERKVFLSKLKTNPLFLLRHLQSLSGVVWQRLKSNKKARVLPSWLARVTHIDSLPQALTFPKDRHLNNKSLHADEIHKLHLINNLEDIEDYFAKNRFNEIIHHLLKNDFSLPIAIKNWLDHPPPKTDPAWETYSTSERVANLITWLSFLPAEQRQQSITLHIITFLYESIHWIANHLEYHGKRTNNHILNNARALIMAGSVLNHVAAKACGITILERMLPQLVQRNGSLRERSSHYQLLITTWLLDIYHFLNDIEREFLKPYIDAMLQVCSLCCDATGNLQAFIGDISPDISPQRTCERLKLFYREFWPAKTPMLSIDDWHILQNKNNKVILNYPTGRYPKTYPAHSHTDITSFVWIYENKPIIVDSGRSRYTKEPIAILQKSALGHNVPLVDDFAPTCESLVINGNWWPKPYAKSYLELERKNDQQIILCHDGFKRTTPVTEHIRNILVRDNELQVTDHFEGKGQVLINILWQMHPAFKNFNKKTLTLSSKEVEVDIHLQPKMVYLPDIEMGWCSSQYGSAQANFVLIIKYMITLPFTTTISFKAKACVA